MIRRIGLVILTCGWLLPLWLAVTEFMQGLRATEVDSFPHIGFAHQAFTIAVVWLAGAIVFWTWKASKTTS